MTEPGTRLRALPQLPITVGSTAYNPGAAHRGVQAWSTTLQRIMEWDGSMWTFDDAILRDNPYGGVGVSNIDRLHSAYMGVRAMLEYDQADDDGVGLPYVTAPADFSTRARSVVAVAGAGALTANGLAAGNVSGTATARAIGTTDAWDGSTRLGFVSALTAGAATGWRHGTAQFYRGSTAAKGGGFFMAARFGFPVVTAGMRIFAGMTATVAAIGAVEPSTLVNSFGLQCNASDTDTFIGTCGAAAPADRLALGLPKATTRVFYDVCLSCRPGGTKIGWAVRRGWWGSTWATGFINAGKLFAADTLLAPQVWASNGATAAVMNLDIQHVYVETDF